MRALRHADEERSLMGFVWPILFSLELAFSKLAAAGYEGSMPQAERTLALQAVRDRWVYLHSPLHSLAYALNLRFVGMDHFRRRGEAGVQDCEDVLTEMLPSLKDVSDALDEYHEYNEKQGRFSNKPLLWIRANKCSPADFWLCEAPKLKWLIKVAARVLSLTQSAGGAERNWSAHGMIHGARRKRQKPLTLERLVRLYCNMRLRDRARGRGRAAQQGDPKPYPLERGDWSSCDDSEDESQWDAAVVPYGFGTDDRRVRGDVEEVGASQSQSSVVPSQPPSMPSSPPSGSGD